MPLSSQWDYFYFALVRLCCTKYVCSRSLLCTGLSRPGSQSRRLHGYQTPQNAATAKPPGHPAQSHPSKANATTRRAGPCQMTKRRAPRHTAERNSSTTIQCTPDSRRADQAVWAGPSSSLALRGALAIAAASSPRFSAAPSALLSSDSSSTGSAGAEKVGA